MTRDEYLRNIDRVADDLIEAVDRRRAESLAERTGFEARIVMEAIRIMRRDEAAAGRYRYLVAANDA